MSFLLEVADFAVQGDGFAARLPELRLAPARVAGLHGPSGCGKTSVLAAMFGLLEPAGWSASGRVTFAGARLDTLDGQGLRALRGGEVVFLVQDAQQALDPLVPVGRQVAFAARASEIAVQEALSGLGVADPAALCARHPHQVSGGEAQRALLAVALLRRPRLVVADEPTASLDGGSYVELLHDLRTLVASGAALLVATHDRRLVRDLDGAALTFQDGAFVREAADEQPWPHRLPTAAGAPVVLRAADVAVRHGSRDVLGGLDLEVARGELVALLGESGAGKTTLLRVLAGHRRPDRGSIARPLRRAAVQLVCQDALGSLTPGRTLASLVAEASAPGFDVVEEARAVRLPVDVLGRTAAAMSGGERRRAALLRALAVVPDVLLLDEPTASLDRAAAVALVEALLAVQARTGVAIVFATHDEALAAVADRRLELRGGLLCQA